jgi:hypothetical protein
MERRKLLKDLAATGVISLPEQWIRPLVEAGTLPGLAQVSVARVSGPTISRLTFLDIGDASCTIDGVTGTPILAGFIYEDPSAQVNDQALLIIGIAPQETLKVEIKGAVKIGFDSYGIVIFGLCIIFGNESEVPISVLLRNGIGQDSNILSAIIPRPPGAPASDELKVSLLSLDDEKYQPHIDELIQQIQS